MSRRPSVETGLRADGGGGGVDDERTPLLAGAAAYVGGGNTGAIGYNDGNQRDDDDDDDDDESPLLPSKASSGVKKRLLPALKPLDPATSEPDGVANRTADTSVRWFHRITNRCGPGPSKTSVFRCNFSRQLLEKRRQRTRHWYRQRTAVVMARRGAQITFTVVYFEKYIFIFFGTTLHFIL